MYSMVMKHVPCGLNIEMLSGPQKKKKKKDVCVAWLF